MPGPNDNATTTSSETVPTRQVQTPTASLQSGANQIGPSPFASTTMFYYHENKC